MTSIDRESDDIFARDEYTDDEEESRGDDVDEEEEDGDDASCELTAAVALTTLVSRSESSNSREQRGEETSKPRSGDKEQEMELQIPQRFTKSGRKRAVSFPLKLLKVLSTTKHSDVIAWTPSGTAFEIRKPKQFVVDILPKYFKSAKYSSFTRKLHRWNFQRHYRGDEAGAFYHPEFIKDRMDLVEQMTCKLDGPSPDTKAKAKTSKPASSGAKKNKPKAKVGAAHPSSAQSRPLVTLNASQVVHNYGGPVMHHRPVVQPQPSSSGLSAAIEMEVARRLEERISAATFSRQALAMLEQQQQQQQQVQATLNAMIERRFQALISHQNNLAAANASARSLASGNLGHHHPLVQGLGPAATRPPMDFAAPAVARPADLAQLYQKFKPAASYNYAFGDDTPALPPTNIQGARTA